MNIITANYDIIFLIIIGASAIFACIRGAIAEILGLSVWFIALWSMSHYGYLISQHLEPSITNTMLRSFVVFVVIFVAVAILIAICKKLLVNTSSMIGLGSLNYLLGAVFGVIRGIFICAFLVVVIELLNLDPSHGWHKSKFQLLIFPVVSWITHTIPEKFATII